MRRSRSLLFFAALAAAPALASADFCEPAPDVAEVLGRIADTGACASDAECHERNVALLQDALAAHPDDVFLHRAFQDEMRSDEATLAELGRSYRERLAKQPERPLWLYLCARALGPGHSDEERGLFNRALARDPDFPWAHLGLAAKLGASLNPEEAAEARQHLDAVTRLCPELVEPLMQALRSDDRSSQRAAAVKLRGLLARRTEGLTFGAYEALWAAEFRMTSPAEHEGLRERIRADLGRIASLGLEGQERWWRTLVKGYELAGDAKGKQEAQRRILERFPCRPEGLSARREAWERDHPTPANWQAPEADAYHEALYQASGEWVTLCPDALSLWADRLGSALSLRRLPDDAVASVAESFLRLWARPRRGMMMVPSPYFRVAQAYLKRGMRLDQIDALVREGTEDAHQEYQRALSGSAGKAPPRWAVENYESQQWLALVIRAGSSIKTGRGADERLAEAAAFLGSHPPKDAEADAEQRYRSAEYWRLKADRAEQSGRRADALAFYLTAIGHRPSDPSLEASAHKLWGDLGGTDEGWRAWTDTGRRRRSVEQTGTWQGKDRPLADFALPDLDGRTWTRADLRGKAALLNFWATWCGPCKTELPFLQTLRERLKGRSDVVLLTLNVDDNPGLVAPFVRAHGLVLPVLLAAEFATKTLEEVGIPCTWIVDREGIVRLEQVGFGGESGERWLEDVLQRLDSVAEGKLGQH